MIIDLKTVPEVTDNRFSMVDDGATEIETGELIYGFVRRLKPDNVLSTGTYTGISDLFIGQALKDNGFGSLIAIEYEQIHIDRARKLWEEKGVSTQITSVKTESLKYEPDRQFQFMFLDTEMNLRLHELVRFFPYLDEGGYVFIHDMPRSLCFGNSNTDHPEIPNWPVGLFPAEFINLLRDRKIVPFHFGGGRGLLGYYKVHKDDYKI